MTVVCVTCKKEHPPAQMWRKVEGWERPRKQGGTNHIGLRVQKDQWMCNGCMVLRQHGVVEGQTSLIG